MGYDDPTKKPTRRQLHYLNILGYVGKIPATQFQATLEIADLQYHWKPKEPTWAQKNKLKKLGHKGPTPKTRGETSELIGDLIKQRGDKLTYDDIPHVIYGVKEWREGDPFEHIHEHTQEFHLAKEWRDSLDN